MTGGSRRPCPELPGVPAQTVPCNWLEAFPFTIVTDDMPNDNKPTPDLTTITSAQVARENVGDGSYGSYYRVDPVIMDEMFATRCWISCIIWSSDLPKLE